jgi:hypothetical protein
MQQHGAFTYALHVKGFAIHVNQVRSSSPMSAIEQLQATRHGRRVMSAGEGGTNQVEIIFDRAHVEGRTRDNTFQFDFDQASAPAPGEDPLRQFAWVLAAAPRRFTVGPNGEYRPNNPNQEAHAEAIGVIVDLPIRLPDGAVTVGTQWSGEWTGTNRKKDGARFQYRQSAQVEEIVAGPSPRARISFSTSGVLQIPPQQNSQGEQTALDASGFVLVDLATGLIEAGESAGAISTDITSIGLKIVHEITTTYTSE